MDSSSDLSSLPDSPSQPSSPLSELSNSPSLPSSPLQLNFSAARYPSPQSTIPSGSASPMKESDRVEQEICVSSDGPPPAKRRKIEPKPRTTEYLNLRSASAQEGDHEELLSRLTNALRKKKKIVVIAGAGISVSAGIPDFRSSHGLFATLKSQHKLKASGKQLFDASVYKHDDSTESFHDMVRELAHQTKNAKPTAFHHMLASIAKEGRLLRLYSQNVDGIDTSMEPLKTNVPLNAKGPYPQTVQLHGGLEKMVCSKCHTLSPFDGSLFEGPEAPPCKDCSELDSVRTVVGKRSHGVGRMRPRMVLYNEYNPDEEAIVNVVKHDIRQRPDAIIVVGTSMKIPGVRRVVKDMCQVTRNRRDGFTAWVNIDSEPTGVDLKNCWDLVVQGKCDDVATMVSLPRWDEADELDEDVIVKGEEAEQHLRGVNLEVRITQGTAGEETAKLELSGDLMDEKTKSTIKIQGIPTPTASPKPRTALPTKLPASSGQSKLSFGTAVAKSQSAAKKTSAPKKPRQQKGRQPKSTAAPKITVKSAFKATKSTLSIGSKPTEKGSLDLDLSLSGKSKLERLAPLRPESRQQNAVYYKQEQHEVNAQLQEGLGLFQCKRPTTPESDGRSVSVDTISPKSKPRGMAEFID